MDMHLALPLAHRDLGDFRPLSGAARAPPRARMCVCVCVYVTTHKESC